MSGFTQWLEGAAGLSAATQGKILGSLIVIAILGLVRWAVVAITRRRVDNTRVLYRWRKTASYITAGIGLVLVGRIWLAGLGSLATFLGLLSAGLAIALKDLAANVAGWVFIVWRQPFEIGDWIGICFPPGEVCRSGLGAVQPAG